MKSILLILGILISSGLFAQAELKSDAVFQNIVREYSLKADGSIELHYYKKLKLNTPYAFNRLYGETFVVYNPDYQTLKINKAETIQSDGSHVKVPDNAFNEILPRIASNAPAYNHLREMVITHPGLEVGAIIQLDYTLTTKAGYVPGLMESIVLAENSPVENEVIRIKIPSDTKLNFQVLNLRTAPDIKDAKGQKEYVFTFKALAEKTHEAHQPTDSRHLPQLLFNTMDQASLLNYLTQQKAFDMKTNTAMNGFVKASQADSYNDTQLILALQKEIEENMNTWPISIEDAGFKLRAPMEVWESNGGTPIEKSVLLAALIRQAGIQAQPVLIIPTDLYNESFLSLNLITEILVACSPRESEQMFISAYKSTSQNKIYSLTGKTVLFLDRKNRPSEKINDVFENKVVGNGTFTLSDDLKLTGNLEVLLTENRNPYYQLMNDSSLIKTLIGGGFSKADISNSRVVNSAQYRSLIDYDIEQKEHLHQQSNYYFWELPAINQGTAAWHLTFLNSERNSPLELAYPVNEQYSFTITLPGGVSLINPLALTEKKSGFGELVLSIEQKENKVVVKRMFVCHTSSISVSDYNEFKAMYDLWNEKNFRKLIFKK